MNGTSAQRKEVALAEFYLAHKDDPAVWGDPLPDDDVAPSPGLSTRVTVRFPHDEAAQLRRLARQLGVPYLDAVRLAVKAYAAATRADATNPARSA